jgi:PAS domain S-box-containing protein
MQNAELLTGAMTTDEGSRQREGDAARLERRLELLAAATGSVDWTAEADGQFGPSQPSWSGFTGQSAASYAGWGWLDAVHPADLARTVCTLTQGVKSGAAFSLEHRLKRQDGAWRSMVLHATPVVWESGNVQEWLGCHTDVTERRQLDEEVSAALEAAATANRARTQFLANMGHELRTPLSAVIGYSEMLVDEVRDSGQAHLLRDLQTIGDNARHLLGIINDVLDLANIENDRVTLLAEDFAISPLLDEVAAATSEVVARKHNVLALQAGAELGAMRSDRAKLLQCLVNLIGGASRLTDDGTIDLTAWREPREGGDWAVFAVRDNGIGMTEEQLASLFSQFAQIDPYINRGGGPGFGTGLGLAVSRGLAVWLGGELEVASAYGVGTTFTLSVPAGRKG